MISGGEVMRDASAPVKARSKVKPIVVGYCGYAPGWEHGDYRVCMKPARYKLTFGPGDVNLLCEDHKPEVEECS